MNTAATFSEAGWSGLIWSMDSTLNDGYPYLSWQHPLGTPLPLFPELSLSRTGIDFGAVPVDSIGKDSVLVSNTGNDTLRITSIVSTNGHFKYDQSTMKIAPAGIGCLTLSFATRDTSLQTGYIILAYNSPDSPDTVVVGGKGAVTTNVKDELDIPGEFEISQNYPNPFNPTTTIKFALPTQSQVTVTIYDILGREVKELVNDRLQAGYYHFSWNASMCASGVYFYRIVARSLGGDKKSFVEVRKLMLVK